MKKSLVTLVVVVALLALLTVTALNGLNLGFTKIDGVADGIVLGLDLVGGSEITYEAEIPEGTSEADVAAGMKSAVTMLRQRLDVLGYTEANVYESANHRIVVEIPNVKDPEEAVQKLGTTAVVTFVDADGKQWLTGSDIKSAYYQFSPIDNSGVPKHHVVLEFTQEGREKFTEATKAVAGRDDGANFVAIVMDDSVISTPYVAASYASTGIDSDSAVISMGGEKDTAEEATYLANIISAGQMPFSLECVKLQAVGATLGEKSLESSLMAGLIGIILVCLFMLIAYRVMGAISCIALAIYGTAFCVVLSVFHINLSLPGSAGIILTIGMAVDANVIIYEHIKEDLRLGKTLRYAIDSGYHGAARAIIDSNVTTIIAAAVLLWQGTGAILSFAKTLLLGVVLSMIVMLFFTKLLLKTAVGLKITNLKGYCV